MGDTVNRNEITVRLLLFAQFREALAGKELVVTVPAGTTARDVLRQVTAEIPRLQALEPHVRFIVNDQFVDPGTTLAEGDELAFVPPVAGG